MQTTADFEVDCVNGDIENFILFCSTLIQAEVSNATNVSGPLWTTALSLIMTTIELVFDSILNFPVSVNFFGFRLLKMY